MPECKDLARQGPDRTWLSPDCETHGERTRCEQPHDCEECDSKAIEYVRADVAKVEANIQAGKYAAGCPICEDTEAENAKLRAALTVAQKYLPHVRPDAPVDGLMAAQRLISDALEQPASAELVRQFNAWDGPHKR